MANRALLANAFAPASIAGGSILFGPRLSRRVAAAAWVAATLVAAMASAQAQSNSAYDPRCWTYDQARNVLVSPSAPDQTSDEGMLPERLAIPRQIVNFSEAQPKGSIVPPRSGVFITSLGTAKRCDMQWGLARRAWSGPVATRFRARETGRIGDRLPICDPGKHPRVACCPLMSQEDQTPLGARALYIGNTLYRVRGTNQPWTVGQANSSGCIRMTNEDVIDLYDRVKIGAQIIVRH
ncbi:hypothetical protein X743_11260 [Mesorhizobium sp. LNHC252B00]|nr:hypothetical protein X743_11260 [Mesorhizobium sp. LNHC252B00]